MSIPVFVAPEFMAMQKRVLQIQFTGTVGAATQLTLVSNSITFPYKITGAELVFRDDAANLLSYYVLVSRNTNTSTTSVPPDPNVFSQFSSTPFFVGEGTIKKVSCNVEALKGYEFIKVHTVNGNVYAQTVNVTVTIEEL